MGKKNIFIFIIILILIIAGAVYLSYPYYTNKDIDNNSLAIEKKFDNKIVYTLDVDQSSDKYENDCRSLGADFNKCGSPCAPEAEICASVCAFTCENISGDKLNDSDNKKEEMSKYNNYRYGFGIDYNPNNWQISEDENIINSVFINIYKKNEKTIEELPLDHFANASHVSFYPKGIPTEGISAQTADFNLPIDGISNQDSRLYVLKDGTPFAAMLKPQVRLESWSEAGYIWVRTFINDMASECMRRGEVIDPLECNPLASDDRIMITGSVDEDIWQKEIAMLKTLKFLGNNQDDLIYLESPLPNDRVASPLRIAGQARGQWFFEADFPAVLVDWDGRIIAESNVTTNSDWMTEDYIPFSAELEFDSPYSDGDPAFMEKGSLILEKANPSGLPENDNALEIEIKF